MKNPLSLLLSLSVLSALCVCTHQAEDQGPWREGLTGPFLGQTPPGLTPRLFAPGIVSSADRWEVGLAVSPDGQELFFSRDFPDQRRFAVLFTRLEASGWTQPQEAEFSRGFFSMEPHIPPNGDRLFFFSERPASPGGLREGMWFVEKTAEGEWGEPSFFGNPPVSVARSGNLYTGGYEGGSPVVIPWSDGRYGEPRELGGGADSRGCWEGHPVIAPDESYILFDARYDPGGQGGIDLWVCFRRPDGTWSEPANLGPAVNTPGDDWIASVSPDGEYIFYASDEDIYWVSARILDGLKEEAPDSLTAPASPSGVAAPQFVKSPQTFEPQGAHELFLEDLDADGDVDAMISSYGNSLILKNDGSGRFIESRRMETMHGLVVGDIDGDGDSDLVLAPQGAGREACDVYRNDGRGEFDLVDSELCTGEGRLLLSVQLADLDGDGDLDALNSRPDGVGFAWVNDGAGRFAKSGLSVPPHPSFSDLNGDGYVDALSRESELEAPCDMTRGAWEVCGENGWVPRGEEMGIRVFLNDRTGGFQRHAFLPLSPLVMPDHALSRFIDLDKDGDQDVVYTDGLGVAQAVGVLRNDGTGRLSPHGAGLPAVENGRIGAGDLDADGFVDLVITNHESPAQIWMNDGTGTFHDSGVRLGERFGSQSLGVADLDGDGDLDIFITDYRRPGTSVWFNQLRETAR